MKEPRLAAAVENGSWTFFSFSSFIDNSVLRISVLNPQVEEVSLVRKKSAREKL